MEHAACYVDILNLRGRVVGKKLRRAIDKLRDIYHSVHVLLITPRGELVLSVIPAREDLPNLYSRRLSSTVATIRRTGETAQKAAIRALARELFIDDGSVVLLGEKMFKLPAGSNYITAYCLIADPPPSYSVLDIDSLAVTTTAELRDSLKNQPDTIAPALKAIWNEFGHRLPV